MLIMDSQVSPLHLWCGWFWGPDFEHLQKMLQKSKALKVIHKNIQKGGLRLLKLEENYKKFYKVFTKNLKLGVLKASTHQWSFSELLCCHASQPGEEMTPVSEYVFDMKEMQKSIYGITGENKEWVTNSAFTSMWGSTLPLDKYGMHQLKQLMGGAWSLDKDGLETPEKKWRRAGEVLRIFARSWRRFLIRKWRRWQPAMGMSPHSAVLW